MNTGTDLIVGAVAVTLVAGGVAAQPVLGGLAEADGVSSAGSAAVTTGSPFVAQPGEPVPLAFDLTGTLTQGQNLAFAVFNGDVRFQAPEPGDLPLFVSGALVVGGDEPSFELSGSFTSPTRSYVFDVFVDGFEDGLTVTPNTVVIADSADGFAFDLVINRQTGTGSFSYSETVVAGGVELTRVAVGTISAAVPVPSPGSGALALAASGLVLRRRR